MAAAGAARPIQFHPVDARPSAARRRVRRNPLDGAARDALSAFDDDRSRPDLTLVDVDERPDLRLEVGPFGFLVIKLVSGSRSIGFRPVVVLNSGGVRGGERQTFEGVLR